MSTLRERVEGLVAQRPVVPMWSHQQSKWVFDGKLYGDGTQADHLWSVALARYADELEELAAALAAEGAEPDNEKQIEHEVQEIICDVMCGIDGDIRVTRLKVRNRIDTLLRAAAPSLHKEGAGGASLAQKLQKVVDKLLAEAERLHNLIPDERERDSRRNGLLEAVAAIVAFTAEHDCGAAVGTDGPLPLQRTLPDEQFKGVAVEPIETERVQGFEEWWQQWHQFSTDSDRLDHTILVLSAPFQARKAAAEAAWNAALARPAGRAEQPEEAK